MNTCGDPVNMATGAFWTDSNDFRVKGRSPDSDILLTRTYIARPLLKAGDFGPNWTSRYETRIMSANSSSTSNLVWIDERGGPWTFTRLSNGNFQSPAGLTAKLYELEDTYQLFLKNGVVYFFSKKTEFGPIGHLIQISDRFGETISFEYDSNEKLAVISSDFAGEVQYTRNSDGYVSSVYRVRDNLTYSYTYNSNHELMWATDFDNRTTSYDYQLIGSLPEHYLTTITDSIGRTTDMTYDSKGRVIRQTEKGGGFRTFTYSEATSPYVYRTDIRDVDGSNKSQFFDANYRMVKYQNPDGYPVTYTWTSDNKIASVTDEKYKTTNYTYDARGNKTSVQLPGDSVASTFEYDQYLDVMTSQTPILDASTTYILDDSGNVTQISRPFQTSTKSISMTYDDVGNVLNTNNGQASYTDQTNEDGLKTYVYDLHNSETRAYDSRGRLYQSTFQSGRVLTYTYNNDDQVTQITDNSGPTTQFTYDIVKRLTQKKVTDGTTNQITAYTWDGHDRLLTETDPSGKVTTYEYDVTPLLGDIKVFPKPIKITDANGHETLFDYDNFDRLVKKTDANGAYTQYTYDARGDLSSVTDPGTNEVTHYFWYDDKRNLSYKAEYNPRRVSNTAATIWVYTYYTYDAQNRVTTEKVETPTDPWFVKSVVTYTYDEFGRVSTKKIYREDANGYQTVDDESTYAYDVVLNSDKIVQASNDDGYLEFAYEHAPPFNLTGSTTDNDTYGDMFSISYSNYGTVQTVQDQSSHTVYQKQFNNAGSLTAILSGNYPGILANGLAVSIDPDSFNRKSLVTSYTLSSDVTANYSYDLNNRVSSLTWTPSGPPLTGYSESLTYDNVGNLHTRTRGTTVETFGYDPRDQITQVSTQIGSATPTVRNLTYDANGNRTANGSNSYTYLNNFQINGPQTAYYATADGTGALEQEEDTNTNLSSNYVYRADGRIAGFYRSNGNYISYSYDALGRRSHKDYWNSSGSNSTTDTMVYLGPQDKAMLTKNQSGALALYLDGEGIDEHYGFLTSSVSVPFITDYLGSVINTAPAGGMQTFGTFGETPLSKYVVNSTPDVMMYGFAGRSYDRESGLYYMRARMYDPNQGRFVTRDPLGLNAGDDNLYRYVLNNPLKYTDPNGLLFENLIAHHFSIEAQTVVSRVEFYVGSIFLLAGAYSGNVPAAVAGAAILYEGKLNSDKAIERIAQKAKEIDSEEKGCGPLP
jgi:RHS repeat-associated protein